MKDTIIIRNYNKNYYKKYENQTIDNVILKCNVYHRGRSFIANNIKTNNFIIDLKRDRYIDIRYVNSKNIFFKDTENLGGITFSYDHLLNSAINSIEFSWEPNAKFKSNIEKINIIMKNTIHKINIDKYETKEIKFYFDDFCNLIINIKCINSKKIYTITEKEEIKEETIYYSITKKDLINEELDLTKFNDLSAISLDNIEIETLIINKDNLKNISKLVLYDDVYIKQIKIIDENNMKLNPITLIPFNDTLDYFENYIIGDNKETLIYLDSKNKIQVFNKKDILKDKNIEKVEFIYDEKEIIIIYKYKKDYKYKIIIDHEYFDINKLFTLYYKEYNKDIKSNDWIEIMKNYLRSNSFIDIANNYKDFKINLKKLLEYGFSYKYLMYLHKRGLDSVIYEMCKKDYDITKFEKDEVDVLNELGKRYIKKLKK